jgi:hypothetical protein
MPGTNANVDAKDIQVRTHPKAVEYPAVGVEDEQTQNASDDDDGLGLGRKEVTVRPDIAAGLDRVQQPVYGVSHLVKVPVQAHARRPSRFVRKVGEHAAIHLRKPG